MAYREDEVTHDRGSSSRQIRHEIESTRREMDRNLDALESKLTPAQLAMEAWGLFRGGSTAGASRLWKIARQHPGPAAVIGVGLAWLLSESTKSGDRADPAEYRYRPGYAGAYGYTGDSDEGEGRISAALHNAGDKVSSAASTAKDAVVDAKDRVTEAAGAARERASELSWQARERARYRTRQARVGFWETMEERPLALGAAAIALGVVAGLMIPSTRKEDELMGETRDRLMERAKEVGGEALEKGKHVAHVAVDTLKEEAERQDLTPGKLAEKARTVAREATSTVKETVKSVAPQGAEQREPELVRK